MNDTGKVHLLLSLKWNKQVKFNKVPVFMRWLKRLQNLRGKAINCDGEQQEKHIFLVMEVILFIIVRTCL